MSGSLFWKSPRRARDGPGAIIFPVKNRTFARKLRLRVHELPMTFIINQQGRVYQKNLGQDTSRLAAAITAYDPEHARFRLSQTEL